MTTFHSDKTNLYFQVAPRVWGLKDFFVNIYMIQNRENDNWVLVDTGLKTSAGKIRKMAKELFGEKKPKAIILTHGHFDHTGSLLKLARDWDVLVYTHYLELPYLTSKSSYPPPDPTVGGGMMATMSFLYPYHPIDVEAHLKVLAEDGSVPGLSEWRYIHTPGHAPGHISLFRDGDKVLIAGDAFVTTNQQSLTSVINQTKELHGPPTCFTYDWTAAKESVKQLLDLTPEIVATGHGKPMYGKEMRKELHNLYDNFEELAIPSQGRYVDDPAVADASGILYLPPKIKSNQLPVLIIGVTLVALTTTLLIVKNKRKKKNEFLEFIGIK